MRILILSLCLALFTGCNTFPLDEKWRPLEEIVERPAMRSGDGITTTVGTRVYRANLDEYLEENPPGSVRFDSLMYHEQVHSKRQLKTGLAAWLSRYGTDKDFMWAEEQLGWYTEIMNLKRRGWQIYPEAIAKILSEGYTNLRGPMISYEDALQWIRDVIAGCWKPAEEDLWSLPVWLRT